MGKIIDFPKKLKDKSLYLKVLETLVLMAIFDPSEKVREKAIGSINRKYNGEIKSGFVGDCQVMIEIQDRGESKLRYLCEAPKEYLGEPMPHPFEIN